MIPGAPHLDAYDTFALSLEPDPPTILGREKLELPVTLIKERAFETPDIEILGKYPCERQLLLSIEPLG
jgi:hypothetical protein